MVCYFVSNYFNLSLVIYFHYCIFIVFHKVQYVLVDQFQIVTFSHFHFISDVDENLENNEKDHIPNRGIVLNGEYILNDVDVTSDQEDNSRFVLNPFQ